MRDEAHSEWLQYARRNVFDRPDLTKFVNTTLTLALDIYLGMIMILLVSAQDHYYIHHIYSRTPMIEMYVID